MGEAWHSPQTEVSTFTIDAESVEQAVTALNQWLDSLECEPRRTGSLLHAVDKFLRSLKVNKKVPMVRLLQLVKPQQQQCVQSRITASLPAARDDL